MKRCPWTGRYRDEKKVPASLLTQSIAEQAISLTTTRKTGWSR
ncbi:unnamed protein product [Onchocerca flexuosa]|uniref:Transposase n=1 Tax=Onchocerca flexuosa TaxID=387005 RepID=A0A183I3I0_9BILA|nr:unnamed protein product [Onchocerca flexuosa]